MLRIILALFTFLACPFLCTGCVSSRLQESSALTNGQIRLADYRFAVIYESSTASFFELELETLLESFGLAVIGETDGKSRADRGELVLGTRASEQSMLNGYGQVVRSELIVLLEDVRTDKTLVTASGSAPSRNSSWRATKKELTKAFTQSK